jgi:hypothetical protein
VQEDFCGFAHGKLRRIAPMGWDQNSIVAKVSRALDVGVSHVAAKRPFQKYR